jgi:hypothetical protein
LFFKVTVSAALVVFTTWLPKDKVPADRATGTTPAPLSVALCGLVMASSVMVKAPARFPSAAGVNVMLIVQLAPAANALAQLFKSRICKLRCQLKLSGQDNLEELRRRCLTVGKQSHSFQNRIV